LARVYYFAEAEAREINLRFAVEGDLLCSVGSFFTQMPSTEYIQLMENSIVQMISYQDYRRLLGEYPDLGNLFRTLYEQRFIMNELRTKLVLEPNYTKRYLDFLKVYPGLLNRIRMNQLASFLGMSYSKLCHIRGELQDEEKKRLPNQ
jgi:CRP/FNR family transcriptional regulator, anaerobic regulatory protein